MYVCGITPYDTTHVGHAFTYAAADHLARYLEHLGHEVRYVQNVTDIDDDILKRAQAAGEDWRELGNRWTEHYVRDMVALNIRPPDALPRATEAISEILEAVGGLLEQGVAYVSSGSVYFDTDAWPAYGRLSKLARTDMLSVANERGNVADDPGKRRPLDFVLWQAARPGEPFWASPWGPGRPGWHIECSSLCRKFLGDALDLHAGGLDLIFPHHESEIAQIEPITGKPFVRTWMHVAMVRHGGEKMSKSLGNLVLVESLLRRFPADALRWYLASHHYREAWDFEERDLVAAETAAAETRRAASMAVAAGLESAAAPWDLRFQAAMEDDLRTDHALGVLAELAERIAEDGLGTGAQLVLRRLAAILGLRLDGEPEERVRIGWEALRRRFVASGLPPVGKA
jgi:L-cysteine:1D-myo-inositol 2-amino-2-deoxy-alpha-D-glucopyranoside ligase